LITVALIVGIVGCGGGIELEIDPDTGEILEDIIFTSPDEMLTVTIPEGTIALDKDDNPLLTLRVDNDPNPPEPPEGAHIIGLAYDFDPAGTTFDPAMTLTWKYSPADIPEGVDEEDLVIAYYDEASGEWVILESVVDTATNTITALVYHLTTFATVAVPSVQYDLTIASTAGGSVTTPGEGIFTYDEGTVVDLMAEAEETYHFVNWTGDVGTIANVNDASTTIIMGGNYSITANFEELLKYSLTTSSTAGGLVTTPGEGTFTYYAGMVIDLVAEAEEGYQFVNWTGDVGTVADVNGATTTITMNGGYSITANFVVAYDLTISSTSGGSVTAPGEGTFTYDADIVVNLVASPASGYRFVNWIGDVGTIDNVNSSSTTITMNGDYSITAYFIAQYDLTISSTAGGSVTTPGEVTSTYDKGTVVNLVATPDSCYSFVDWTGNVGAIANVNAALTTITMNSDYSITANFEEEEAVTFPDPNLEAAIREAIGKPTGPICPSDLEGLTSLDASKKNIADITGLENCTSLTWLNIYYNQISNISPLANLTSLAYLWIGVNSISDISPLANLTNLTEVNIKENSLSDISALANLTSLTRLIAESNQISDISPLANLTSLTYLNLQNNQISNISPLANLTSLTRLPLEWNQISDISALANLTSLTYLNLQNNQINDISPLANLTNLTWLNLSYMQWNQISDISPLANLTNLTWLNLSVNQIYDISPLVDNPGLGEGDRVFLGNNPLSSDSINIYIPQLEARGVAVYY